HRKIQQIRIDYLSLAIYARETSLVFYLHHCLKNKSKLWAVTAWLISVLLFSVVYWLIWINRPDSFILHKEFNLTPYDQLITKLWVSDNSMWSSSEVASLVSATELDEFAKFVNDIDREATLTQEKLRALEVEQTKLENAEKVIYAQHSEKLWINVERYKQDAVRREVDIVERAKSVANSLSKVAEQVPSSVAAAIAAADANVELARSQYELAARRSEAADYVLSNLRELSDSAAVAQIEKTETNLRKIRAEQTVLTEKLSNIRSQTYERLADWRARRTARLLWIDFLYYSVGISTTTTFGDITPNSRSVRVVVLFQLIFSVLLVGYFIGRLGATNTRLEGGKGSDKEHFRA
ncbi:MAG: potassium channel family protein, partial [Comamonas sp.]